MLLFFLLSFKHIVATSCKSCCIRFSRKFRASVCYLNTLLRQSDLQILIFATVKVIFPSARIQINGNKCNTSRSIILLVILHQIIKTFHKTDLKKFVGQLSLFFSRTTYLQIREVYNTENNSG